MSHTWKTDTALLTATEEVELAKVIEAGRDAEARLDDGAERPGDGKLVRDGLRARKRFLESNVRLVLSVASKMKVPAHVDRQDVIQDGMLGLERAVTKFDWRRGYKFSTYATWW
ncbi:MAG: sigma-70 family RNA polymerase sigma factor, partial [Acidimicrobiia bacterium]|nr:sigma-70 family RNA polymerase sigma factor [Acidimicrobiia bacterium]